MQYGQISIADFFQRSSCHQSNKLKQTDRDKDIDPISIVSLAVVVDPIVELIADLPHFLL